MLRTNCGSFETSITTYTSDGGGCSGTAGENAMGYYFEESEGAYIEICK